MFNTMNIHFNTCLLLVQPMKNHPDITENVLTGTSRIKSSKQTSILVQTILGICQACICLQTKVFDKLLLYFYRKKVVVSCAKFTYILVLLALEIGTE